MFYQNMEIGSPRKDLCEGSPKSLLQNTDWCTTNNFRIQTLSSNNPGYLTNKTGYVVCENDSEHALILVEVRFKATAYSLLILSRKESFQKTMGHGQWSALEKRRCPWFSHFEHYFRIQSSEIFKKNVTIQSFSSQDQRMI